MQSCIYEGRVRHTRLTPATHRFDYRVFMMYLDLDELESLFKPYWAWSTRRPALARFKRSNYFGPGHVDLADAIRDQVEKRTGFRPGGPIRLLTNLSYFGYCFNPVSYYYCYDQDDSKLEAILADVSNTPWGEKTSYVLLARHADPLGNRLRFRERKTMHVSPFMPMDVDYQWCLSAPASELTVHMANLISGKAVFNASVNLKRREIGSASLARVLLTYPFMTVKIIVAIHWQALRLWLKGCPVHAHPGKRSKYVVSP